MNKFTLALLLGAASANSSDSKMVQIVEGVLKGALDAEGFTDIEKCVQDTEHVISDVEVAVKDFEGHSLPQVVDGIKKIADILKTVKVGMKDCSSMKADWAKLEAMVKVFDSPTSFAYHVGKDLLVNGVQIYGEINTAVTDYKAGQWNDFGYQIGEAAAKTILGEESRLQLQQDKKMMLAQIFEGILEAFDGKFDLYALLLCVYEEDQAALMFDVAVQSFEKAWADKDFSDAIGGIIAIIAGIQQFEKGLPACEAIDTTLFDFKDFEQCLDIAKNPMEHFMVLEEDVLINGVSIIADAKSATQAYRAGDFLTFGRKIGQIVKLSTVEEKVEEVAVPLIDDRTMVAEVAQGLLEGTKVGTFNFTNLLICIYEADQAALILYQAVDLLKEAIHDKNIGEAIGGVIASLGFVQQLRQSIPVCESVDSKSMNWTTFNKIVEVAEDPKNHMQQIGEDVLFNGVTITEDLRRSIEAFRSGEFRNFGFYLGNVLSLATETPENLFLY